MNASPATVENVLAWLKRERLRQQQARAFDLIGSPAQIQILRSLLALHYMSRREFDDSDPSNLPVFIDPRTGEAVPTDDPMVIAAAHAFKNHTTLDERQAWHAVTCLNSRDPAHLAAFFKVTGLIQDAIRPHAR
jgi:hypothetical protein